MDMQIPSVHELKSENLEFVQDQARVGVCETWTEHLYSVVCSCVGMKKQVQFCCVLVIVLLLTACTPGSRSREGPPSAHSYRTGSEGLRMTIPVNTPPPQVFDYQELNVLVELENRGAYTIPGDGQDRVYLSGFDNTIITNIPVNGIDIPELEGVSYYGPGSTDVVTFQGILQSGYLKNPYPTRLMVTACYAYETVAEAAVCIDPDPFTTSAVAKACVARPVSLGTQGAPVAVQRVDVEPGPGRTRFAIQIANAYGGGEPFRPGTEQLDKCSPYSGVGLDFRDINHVEVVDVSINGQSILSSCKPLVDSRYIRLDRGGGTLYCDLHNLGGTNAYTTPLQVTLRYGYRQNTYRDVTIVPDV